MATMTSELVSLRSMLRHSSLNNDHNLEWIYREK